MGTLRRLTFLACVLAALPGCSHHHLHHIYNEPHHHKTSTTGAHRAGTRAHSIDEHPDTVHSHSHHGGGKYLEQGFPGKVRKQSR